MYALDEMNFNYTLISEVVDKVVIYLRFARILYKHPMRLELSRESLLV